MFGTIVLAVDGSAQAERAAEVAGMLATAGDDEVIVLHVIQEHLIQGGGVLATMTGEGASELVERVMAALTARGAKARPEVARALDGYVGRVIATTAEEHGAGLVVMGSRSRTDLGALLLGSVAHKVLHLAHCPVLIAR